ncbi:hypothetical protein GCM10010193_13810 [Kitasatospora atroaurantiaca]|uniref:non-specific serine/threonine protein kinase n=1 Tax=Kitasatospora atroaurantiaca TaxID=285545 RepID=A0A561ESX2_9ACTN|nr:serine/threonine-protein kinase [Kitasatospora atroaurantiaca]TWE18715.1 serine/threonine-protein kinase [Kitasatospora atroaurantiaca]
MEAGGILADRYVLVRPVARGAQGTVWRAVDRVRGTDVAVKVSGTADVEALLRLVCEQSVRIGHPHVLVPVDWFVREDEAWLVLPLVRGGTLAGLLADYGQLPAPVGLLIAEQLLDALAAVHAAGLVHRDVKPSNLLLAATGTGRPHVFLADFGVARVLPHLQLTSHALVVGTPDYLAPEVRAGEGSSPAQDVYAAGLVLTGLGALPALVAAMTADRPELRPSAAAARDEIARARAALGPEQWPVEWEGEAFAVLDQLPAGPAPEPETPRTAAGPRRTVLVTTAALAALAAAAVALGAGGAPDRQDPRGDTPAPRSTPTRVVPSDADTGLPDPQGPTAFSRCEARQQFTVRFSPEGYLLLCTHVPATRDYEWAPQSDAD